MSTRQKFQTRQILLRSSVQHETLLNLINSLPLDDEHPLEVVVREPVKVRVLSQNNLMWVGPLADIAEQAYVGGRNYTPEIWHEFFKATFLPETHDPEYTKDGYIKWDYTPAGERVLIGSTTQLTKLGFSDYLEQIMAYGSSLGVLFGERSLK